MTYPLVFHLGTGVRDLGDPLLNSWIMAWNARQIGRVDFSHYFDANIFFPHQRTLAYSEHLFTESLVALPFLTLFKNPLLAHNIVLLFAFVTSAFGMYALAVYLTGSRPSGFVAGLVYSFSPFMFSHFVHVQVLLAGGIPLVFLFLHRYFDRGRTKDACLFAFFFSFQALANGYYALYLGLFAGLFIAIKAVTGKRLARGSFWRQMLLAGGIICFLVGPFAYQYLRFRGETSFVRSLGSSARLSSYLAPAPSNRLYGPLTSRFQRSEEHLFPGGTALLLALGGLTAGLLRKSRWIRPNADQKASIRGASTGTMKPYGIYGVFLGLAFLFSFGPAGPYVLLYRYIPGFNGLRVPARIHIMTMLSIAVLAAFGMRFLTAKIRGSARAAAVGLIAVLVLVEFVSAPVPLTDFPPGGRIPEVYRWLAAQKEEGLALLELPLPAPRWGIGLVECPRMYFSTVHWHKLVNGYSGYFPPLYDELLRRWRECSLGQNIADARDLGVRLLVFHSSQYSSSDFAAKEEQLAEMRNHVRLLGRFGEAVVYEIRGESSPGPDFSARPYRGISRTRAWKASASINEGMAGNAVDGDRRTRWNSDFQTSGDSFTLDLGKEYEVRGLSLKLGPSTADFPRGCRVELSRDGEKWDLALEQDTPLLPITSFLEAGDISYDIVLPPRKARLVRLTLTRGSDQFYWSIYEIEAFE